MSGNRDEIPDPQSRERVTPRQRREEIASELGIDAEFVSVRDTTDSGLETRLTDEGQRAAEQQLASEFASEQAAVTPADVTATVDQNTLAADIGIADDRRDAVRERARDQLVSNAGGIPADAVSVDVTERGVEGFSIDQPTVNDSRREELRADAAAEIEGFGVEDIEVEQTESGFEAQVEDSALRARAADQSERFGPDAFEVVETDSGQQARLANGPRREAIQDQVASSFEFADISPDDISVGFEDGEPSVSVPESAQRTEAIQQAASEFSEFDAGDLEATETDAGGFNVQPTTDAAVVEARQQAVATQIAAADPERAFSVFADVEDRLDDDDAETIRSQFSETLNSDTNTIDPTLSETFTDALSDRALGDRFLGIDYEVISDAKDAVELSPEQERQYSTELSEAASDNDPVDVADIPDPVQEQLLTEQYSESRAQIGVEAVRRNTIDGVAADLGISADNVGVEAVETESGTQIRFTESFEQEVESRQREQLRDRLAADAENFGADDVVISEEDGQLVGEISDAAQRERIRQQAASELEQFGTDDITVTQEGDEFRARVSADAQTEQLLTDVDTETLFATTAGGDAARAAVDLRDDLRTIAARSTLNTALENSGADLRSSDEVGEILTGLDPEQAEEYDIVDGDLLASAQDQIAAERQEAEQNPAAFLDDVDENAITDALSFDRVTQRGSDARAELRDRADEIESNIASDVGVDASAIEFRATLDGLEATEGTRATLAREQAADEFGVDAEDVTLSDTEDGFSARLDDELLAERATEQAASQSSFSADVFDASVDDGSVSVGFDRDALTESFAAEQGIDTGNVAVRETTGGLELGIDPDVLEDRIEAETAFTNPGIDREDVSASADSAFDTGIETVIDRDAAGADNIDRISESTPDIELTREQAWIDALTGGRFEPVVDVGEGGRRAVADTIGNRTRGVAGIDEPTPQQGLTGEQELLDEVSGGLFGDVAAGAEQARSDVASGLNSVGGQAIGVATLPARTLFGAGQSVADTVEEETDGRTAESALGLGAAGVVTPEPVSTISGAAVATLAGGALVADAARRGELDLPDREELFGGGATSTAEIDAPEEQTPASEVTVPDSPERAPEVEVGETAVTSEIDAPERPGQQITEIDVPDVSASAISDGTISDFPTRETPEVDQPTIEQPDVGRETFEEVDRQPVVFPGESATTSTEAIERPAVTRPTTDETFSTPGRASGTTGSFASPGSGVESTVQTQPTTGVTSGIQAEVADPTVTNRFATPTTFETPTVTETGAPTGQGPPGETPPQRTPRGGDPPDRDDDNDGFALFSTDLNSDLFGSGIASAEDLLGQR